MANVALANRLKSLIAQAYSKGGHRRIRQKSWRP